LLRKIRNGASAIALALGIGFAVSACAGGAGAAEVPAGSASNETTYTLMMSTQLAPTSPMVEGFYAWADAVAERSNGRLNIEVFPSAQLGSDEDVIEQATQGLNVAVLTDGGRMANFVNDIGIIGMPFIADNYDDVLAITETDIFAGWEEELATQHNIRVLSFNWYDGARHFLTNTPIMTPDDLNGLQIRTPGAPVWAESVAAMGATPVAMPFGETYNAIQTGVIDGAEVQHTSTLSSRLYEVLSYVNKTHHFQLVNGIIVGETWFNSLPEDLQVILVEEARAAAAVNARKIEGLGAEIEEELVANGMTIVESDVEAFRAAAQAAYETLGFTELRDRIFAELGRN